MESTLASPRTSEARSIVRLRGTLAIGPNSTRLLSTLTQLMPVRFDDGAGHRDAVLHLVPPGSQESTSLFDDAMSLTIADTAPEDAPTVQRMHVDFANDPEVPFPFRGRALDTGVTRGVSTLPFAPGERVLASIGTRPIWTVREANGHKHFRSALPLAEMADGGIFAQVFNGENFVANLPLLHLLAQLPSRAGEVAPPLRAAFMFDDPNLHWTSYGFVSYLDVLKCAELENFHVSFATIPLDCWFTHKPTAALFRDHPRRLSLLVHGNNHTRHELAKDYSPRDRRALLDQALRRIRRIESHHRISVSRVMVPPHGACSADMLASLPSAGFDAACISSGSLLAHNAGAPWTGSLGFRPAEQVRGCPVLPRWPFSDTTKCELLVAAYLGRPMIVRGHHVDLREGLSLMVETARFINGLGAVQWRNVSDLASSSYCLRIHGSTAVLSPYANRTEVDLPRQVTSLVIEPGADDPSGSGYSITAGDVGAAVSATAGAARLDSSPITVTRSLPVHRSTGESTETTRPRLVPGSMTRRLLTEGRDRLMTLRSVVATR